ncbi:hypothetical protein MPSEU_000516400 [Mayamaea pseudoterrestris]|nr:hypothetical protein MPSEU_000516400 [Mayamaea pseudoterrestris]
MRLSSTRSVSVIICFLSGLVVAAFSSATKNMPTIGSNKRRRVAVRRGLTENADESNRVGKLEELKQKEIELSKLLADVRREKMFELRAKPLRIGIVGFGRFGQFIARTFAKYSHVVVTSRSDYSKLAASMGNVTYVPLSDPKAFLDQQLDVIVFCVSITSFEDTVRQFTPFLKILVAAERAKGGIHFAPLIVDVLSVKEHARDILLEELPTECDILCTHPMFGPDSGRNGWKGLNFVYEKTRIDGCLLDPDTTSDSGENFVDEFGQRHSVPEDSEAHVEGMDRMERFLSIFEEEGCRMVPMSCREHDAHAANSQFVTHLVGRVLGQQGLGETPIDTSGFQSVLKLVQTTTADSFDLFYGLYKYNQKNSLSTIQQLQAAMDDVVANLNAREKEEQEEREATNASTF